MNFRTKRLLLPTDITWGCYIGSESPLSSICGIKQRRCYAAGIMGERVIACVAFVGDCIRMAHTWTFPIGLDGGQSNRYSESTLSNVSVDVTTALCSTSSYGHLVNDFRGCCSSGDIQKSCRLRPFVCICMYLQKNIYYLMSFFSYKLL